MPNILSYFDGQVTNSAPISLHEFLENGVNDGVSAVRIEPGEDAKLLLPHLDKLSLIDVTFPSFADGRGYSSARLLAEAGFKGELRASGDVLLDQIRHFRRCGFNSFAPNKEIDKASADAAIARFGEVYQIVADNAVPIWKKRHG
ncbi:oxidoreductase [Sphingorhabdus lutea]|uniref:Oxidoreductase n=1 Tax=Sphingorhabdus lutea TaxID=1913578 RepID=A0A1L3JB72_9SPHN|nr:DUF934 domain-containing protein [Sphingorhabdus lutea]APG62359.1 oxidoreductase [Sphingorhabdus lutea]